MTSFRDRRLQGKDCSYNPFAFPPSLEVRCRRYDPRASIVPTMLLHFLRPWRSDGGGRAKQEARAESNAGAIAEQKVGAIAGPDQIPASASRSFVRAANGCPGG